MVADENGEATPGIWQRLVPAKWFRQSPKAASGNPSPVTRRAATQTEPWPYDQKIQRALFEDHFQWLELNLKVDPSWTVLEFGTGKWGFSSFYKEHVKHVIGVDIYDYAGFYPDIEFVVTDGKTVPIQDEAVDLVVSHSVLEHVPDVRQSIREIDRVLKVGGYAYLTVAQLYYSASGAHIASPVSLDNWEHLDPNSPYYMVEHPNADFDYLNKLTSSEMLAAVGTVPWDIVRYEIRPQYKIAPDFALYGRTPPIDLYTREFRLVAHRRTRIAANGQFQEAPHPYLREKRSA